MRWKEIWTPAPRTRRQLRHARIKLIASALILAVIVIAAVLRVAA